jgi:membrane protease YdiL (CAAX protease family)
MDNHRRKVALIMLGTIAIQAWPLGIIASQTNGIPYLMRQLGVGARAIEPAAWALGAGVAVAYAALSMRSLPFIRRHALELGGLKLLAVLFALVTGTFEELFFRKMLMDGLAAHGSAVPAQVVLSGLVFGAAHGVWGLIGGNLRAAFKSMAFTTGLGLALAVVYVLAGRQVAPAAWSHILINLAIEPWLLLAVMNLRAERRAPAVVAAG